MRIAFYAPLKSPDHPVPSGDRLMARQLIAALRHVGHDVEIASHFRSFSRIPDPAALNQITAEATRERARIRDHWAHSGTPDLWFTYHPYYKAPDLLGPALSTAHGLRYATAEASFSPKRERDDWQPWQAPLRAALGQACVNICFTRRDHAGLGAALPGARLAMLPPFLDRVEGGLPPAPRGERIGERSKDRPEDLPGDRIEIVTVAMMRPGDKLESYRRLAAVLARLPAAPDWRLTLIGDGPARAEVEGLLAPLPPGRIRWLGECSPAVVAQELASAMLYLWPGVGEAYGLAYLEAQAAGLPVVAEATAGVPDVVRAGETGLLTPPGDIAALSEALLQLMRDPAARARMGECARRFVQQERGAPAAAHRLDQILTACFDGAPI